MRADLEGHVTDDVHNYMLPGWAAPVPLCKKCLQQFKEVRNMGKLQDSAKVIFPLSRAKLLCPDVEEIKVWREPRGVDGWAVLIRYADDTYASFSIDNGGDMLRLTEQAIVKQLEHHENLKRVIE